MDLSWFTSGIIALLVIFLLCINIFKKSSYWEKRGVKGPKQSFFSILGLFFLKKPITEIVVDMYRTYDGEKYFGYHIMNSPVLMVRDIDIINLILVKDFSYFQDRNMPMDENLDLTNAGLANVTGDKWRVLRHKLTPTFTTGKMKMMIKQIEECSHDLVQFIRSKIGNDLETRDFLFKFMINVVGSIAFGINVDAFNEEKEKENDFLNMSKGFFKPSFFLQLKLALFMAAPKLKELLGITLVDKKVNEYFPKLVHDLIKYRKQNKEKRNDFLQLMIDQQEKELSLRNIIHDLDVHNEQISFTDDIIINTDEPEDIELLQHLKNLKYDKNSLVFSDNIITAQAFLFISGGSDTTSSILSFALHYLAMYKDIQKKLQEEVDEILSTYELTYEAIKKMKYLEQFLNEVLRFRTPGGVIARVCVKDYKMPGSDLIIDRGTIIQIPAVGIHKDPQYFPDPDNFNPDRFEDMNSIPKGVFFPFGGGPRMCIAMRLAMLEMKVCIVSILRSCNVLHSKKTSLPLNMEKNSISQHVKGGLWVKFEERQQ